MIKFSLIGFQFFLDDRSLDVSLFYNFVIFHFLSKLDIRVGHKMILVIGIRFYLIEKKENLAKHLHYSNNAKVMCLHDFYY